MPEIRIKVPQEAEGKRVDQFLANYFASDFSRSKIKEFIVQGLVFVDGEKVKPKFEIHANQEIISNFEKTLESGTRAEKIPIKIVYEDKDLLIINKPAGMVVHPACGHKSGTLVNALLYHVKHLSKMSGDIRSGIVHRLDKNTSGLMIVAKNDETHDALAKRFKSRQIEKTYWVFVKGVVDHDEMHCDAPVGRSPHNRRIVMIRTQDGKESETFFKVLKRFSNETLLEAKPRTGRMHQIRVHLKHLGYPVMGDKEYGVASSLIGRQALHAKALSFIHPSTKKKISVESDIPVDMKKLMKSLQKSLL